MGILVWFIIPIVIGFAVQGHVKRQFRKYSKVRSMRGLSAAQVARDILDKNGLTNVPVEGVRGHMTDHYDPRHKVLRLSEPVYQSTSLAAIGIAAHEAGHALQDANGYAPLKMRSALAPVASFGSQWALILAFVGLAIGMLGLFKIGIAFFSFAVLFSIITLPVEFNASKRAMALIKANGYLTQEEEGGAQSVLSAAAMTYVAATLIAVMQLLYMIGLARD